MCDIGQELRNAGDSAGRLGSQAIRSIKRGANSINRQFGVKPAFDDEVDPPILPDPEAERLKLQAEATQKSNQEKLTQARRKRRQAGLLSTEGVGGNVLSTTPPASKSNNVLTG